MMWLMSCPMLLAIWLQLLSLGLSLLPTYKTHPMSTIEDVLSQIVRYIVWLQHGQSWHFSSFMSFIQHMVVRLPSIVGSKGYCHFHLIVDCNGLSPPFNSMGRRLVMEKTSFIHMQKSSVVSQKTSNIEMITNTQ